MKLRVTYEFKVTDVPAKEVVFIGNEEGYIGRGDTLQGAIDQMHEYFTTQIGDGMTFDIVDVRPTQDAELINREASTLRTMKAIGANERIEARTYEERHAFDEHVEVHAELYELVRDLAKTTGFEFLKECIQDCHNGKLRGPIDQSNLHLFRRFRNDPVNGSGEAIVLLAHALKDKNLNES